MLENSKGMTTRDLNVLKQNARVIMASYGIRVTNVRISSFFVQLDLHSGSPISREVAALLEELSGKLVDLVDITRGIEIEGNIVETAVRLFNCTRYWESQEAFEKLWKEERTGPERIALQGLILAGAALVHAEKGETDVCEEMLRRALDFVERSGLKCVRGIDLHAFGDTLRHARDAAEYFELRLLPCAGVLDSQSL